MKRAEKMATEQKAAAWVEMLKKYF
ncbi:hypothetical protein PSEUDO8O_30584 [Pseudomonas sp. 8O]|nr:hypothetical protein PSEUDO8O_30584 [Pseudomonas sp. 8O]